MKIRSIEEAEKLYIELDLFWDKKINSFIEEFGNVGEAADAIDMNKSLLYYHWNGRNRPGKLGRDGTLEKKRKLGKKLFFKLAEKNS